MFLLESADPAQYTVHPVFLTGEVDKLPSQDSSICPHNRTDCIRVDPKVYTADRLGLHICL